MANNPAFDWYQISKMNEQNPNIAQFANVIRHAHFGTEIKKVPNSLKQKLLLLFQNSSLSMQAQYQKDKAEVKDLKQQRVQLNTQIYKLKNQLNASKEKINSDQIVIEQKLKIIEKMKQKINKKKEGKKHPQQVYFCPICLRQDFPSRESFSIHLINEHSKSIQQSEKSNGGEGQIPNDLKDFILSLKNKQIQMMEMMMNKKKQIQTIQLQQIYANSMRKLQNQPNFLDRKSLHTTQVGKGRFPAPADLEVGQQLQGESQYLFYPPDQKYYQGIFHQKVQEQRNSLQNYPQTLSNYEHHYRMNYQRPSREYNMNSSTKPDYYNIFGADVTISQVDNLSPHKQEINTNRQFQQDRLSDNSKNSSKRLSENQRALLEKEKKIRKSEEKGNINASIQQHLFQQKQSSQGNISLTQRSLEPRNKQIFVASNSFGSSKRYESIYNEERKKIEDNEAFIFNSGPLLDDHQSQDSDYEDYFGEFKKVEQNEQSVLDQEIIVKGKKHKYNKISTVNRVFENSKVPKFIPNPNIDVGVKAKKQEVNQSNIALEYSKDKTSLDHSSLKQKSSSDIIELSNSFSKRGLQSSKNQDQTINLSDLKLSKLQKERQYRKQMEYQIKESKDRSEQNQERVILPQIISFKYEMSKKERNYQEGNAKILQQFKKQQQAPPQEYPHAIRKTESRRRQDVIKKYSVPVGDMGRSNPGILNQFFINNKYQ